MGAKEIQQGQSLGTIVPSVEMRKSLEGAERCKAFFEGLKLVDWLNSINEHYLNGSAEVDGPNLRISSNTSIQDSDDGMDVKSFDLESSWGGLKAELKWGHGDDNSQGVITISLFYSNRYDYINLYLEGGQTRLDTNGSTSSFFRDFMLNPDYIKMDDVDDALLTFTSELIDAGILQLNQ
jgi:hypothetical protein